MEIALYLALGAALGAFGMWLWRRGADERLAELRSDKNRLESQAETLQRQISVEQALTATLEERARRIPELEQELAGYQAVREENARLLQELKLERRQADE